jgi:hypothetical protein
MFELLYPVPFLHSFQTINDDPVSIIQSGKDFQLIAILFSSLDQPQMNRVGRLDNKNAYQLTPLQNCFLRNSKNLFLTYRKTGPAIETGANDRLAFYSFLRN